GLDHPIVVCGNRIIGSSRSGAGTLLIFANRAAGKTNRQSCRDKLCALERRQRRSLPDKILRASVAGADALWSDARSLRLQRKAATNSNQPYSSFGGSKRHLRHSQTDNAAGRWVWLATPATGTRLWPVH